MGLENVGGLAMHIILLKLGPTEAASVCCAGKQFQVWASDDSLWAQFCSHDLNLTAPIDPSGNPTPSFKAAYQAWREGFSMYPWSLVIRAKRCWSNLREWLALNLPEILPTLCKGASEDEIEESEKSLKIKLPLPTRVLYRFCDGQYVPNKNSEKGLGIIGGYSLYDHLVNVFLLPLSRVVRDTKLVMDCLGLSSSFSEYILVAASCTPAEKFFFLNCTSGQLFVGTRNLVPDGEMLPCVPEARIGLVPGSIQQDAMLRWLEEHGRRLENGDIKVRREGKIRSINLFPELPPLCSSTVTNGVKVRASSVFVPECSDLQDESNKFLFAYSIRLSLSPDGCVINGMTFNSCQLYWRHWLIRVNDAMVSDVNGEAVIGKFPLLRPGEEEFVYESCTPLPAKKGSIEGSFSFVPGSLADVKGTLFGVEVSRFPLQLPNYIF